MFFVKVGLVMSVKPLDKKPVAPAPSGMSGGGGADVYLFGRASDPDTVDEGWQNLGSSGDKVRLVKGMSASALSLSRNELDYQFAVERAELDGGVDGVKTTQQFFLKFIQDLVSDGSSCYNAVYRQAEFFVYYFTFDIFLIQGGTNENKP